MTDRYHALTVILEKDIRSDDCQPLIESLKMMKGVLDVKPIVTEFKDHMARFRIRQELIDKLFKVLQQE